MTATPTRDWLDRSELEEPASRPPALLVVIDTEEEFDWNAPFDRKRTSVEAMAASGRAQTIFDEFGLVPTWVVDHPVASQPEGYAPLKEFADAGRATIGAHLHPWVSPPHEEEVNARNSYPGNLPAALEEEKLRRLTEQIEASFGRRPTVYKAGRYGFGPNTAEVLERLGYEVDLSACPPFDHRGDGGPDYTTFSARPFWFGRGGALLGLPTTGEYVGWWPQGAAHATYRKVTTPTWSRARIPGILSRLRALERIRLSPEGYQFDDLVRLTRGLHTRGVRTFTFSFHSPSLEPGHTTFVRSDADLRRFLDTFRRYFDWFLGAFHGVGTTPDDQRRLFLDDAGRSAAS